jgi:hypothetical protein
VQLDELDTLLANLKGEQAALADLVRAVEGYVTVRGQRTDRRRDAVVQQPQLAGLKTRNSRNAVKGSISIRKAIAEVLREAKRPMKADEIWGFAYDKGARTNSKRPEAIVALTCNGMDEVEKIAPRTFQWKLAK